MADLKTFCAIQRCHKKWCGKKREQVDDILTPGTLHHGASTQHTLPSPVSALSWQSGEAVEIIMMETINISTVRTVVVFRHMNTMYLQCSQCYRTGLIHGIMGTPMPNKLPYLRPCLDGKFTTYDNAERYGSSSSVVFQNYKFNFATENSEQLLSVFVTGSVVMTVILNTTFVLWLTAQSVHCTLLQPGCTKIFNGLDLIQFSVANGTAGG